MVTKRKENTYTASKADGTYSIQKIRGHSLGVESDTGQILIYREDENGDEVIVAVFPKDFTVICD